MRQNCIHITVRSCLELKILKFSNGILWFILVWSQFSINFHEMYKYISDFSPFQLTDEERKQYFIIFREEFENRLNFRWLLNFMSFLRKQNIKKHRHRFVSDSFPIYLFLCVYLFLETFYLSFFPYINVSLQFVQYFSHVVY